MNRARGAALLLLAGATGMSACGGQRPVEPRPAVRRTIAPPPPPTVAKQPPASAPARVPSAAEPPPEGAVWGWSGPVALLAAAPDRRWLAVCEARRDTTGDGMVRAEMGPQGDLRGDRLEAFFIGSPGGLGESIDAFVGSDPVGRFVAFVRKAELVLRNTTTGVDVVLRADVRDDDSPFIGPRVGEFDPTGRRFLYLRAANGTSSVVVRDLATGVETEIESGPGELWRAAFDPSGEWVIAGVIATDTNGNGRLDWPTAPRPPTARCPLPLPRYSLPARPGDDPLARVAPATGGASRGEPGLIVPLGDALVAREPDGALVRVTKEGTRQKIVEASCAPRVLHADPTRHLLLFTCAKKNGKSDARILTPDGTRPLGIELAAAAGDRWVLGAPRLLALYPGTDTLLVDLDRRGTERLRPGDRVVGTAGDRALLLRGQKLVVHDLGGAETALGGEVLHLEHVLRSGNVVLLPPLIVDVAAGAVLGTAPQGSLAVALDGSVLVATGGPADARRIAMGPLRWVRPGSAE